MRSTLKPGMQCAQVKLHLNHLYFCIDCFLTRRGVEQLIPLHMLGQNGHPGLSITLLDEVHFANIGEFKA